MTDVSVVIATRDRCARLRHTLDRLAALPERPPVIVVDNGSSDGTRAMLAREHPEVHVVALGRNHGAVARNAGVRAAATPYVAFADDDSWWAPGALARASAHFAAYPRLGLLAARTLVGPRRRVDPLSQVLADSPLGRREDLPGPSVLGFLACASVVRRSAYLTCGGFDPVVFFFGEESRLAYDLAAAGWGLAYCADVVAYHHPDPAGAAGAGKRLLAVRNEVLTGWLRRPLGHAVAGTAELLRRSPTDPQARRAAGQVLARLGPALLRRRRPHSEVEAALARLASAPAPFPAAGPVTAPAST